MLRNESWSFSTLAARAGGECDPATGAIVAPIHQTTTFVQEGVGRDKGHTYSRSSNPTVSALERRLGEMEGAPPALAFATGMAAITALCVAGLESGDHVVVSEVVYGGTARLLRQVLAKYGVAASFVDAGDPDALARALRRPTRFLLVESPANPTLKLADLRACAAAAHDAGALLAVDNTFLTAAAQRPFELGADVVVYSTTKAIEGHNTAVGGALLARDEALLERVRFVRNATGSIQAPFDAWLTLRGLKTLPLRMERHGTSALRIAAWLETHPRVRDVRYPWLASFPQHALARAQQGSGGGIVAFRVDGGREAAVRALSSLRLCSLAESLGSVETLVTHPATMTHASLPEDVRARLGIGDDLVRLSVGLEDPADVISDLEQALARA